LDVKNYYVGTPIPQYEYMHILISLILQDIIDVYYLQSKVHNGYVYMEIRPGVYSLPPAGYIANDLLQK
jgi:hypothetical protein